MNSSALGNVDNDIDVGVVVVVGSTGDLDVLVSHANVVGVDLEILGRGHDGKLDGALRAESLVGPFPDGADLLDGGDSVVGDENLVSVAGGGGVQCKCERRRESVVGVSSTPLMKA